MKKKHYRSGCGLSGFCLLLLILCCAAVGRAPAEVQQPEAAPDDGFSLKSTEGETVSLKDYRGTKLVHLIFWATWCPHCLIEMTKIRELHSNMDGSVYEILAIDVGVNDTLQRIKKIQKQYQIPGKILIDEKGEVTRKYGIIGVPYHIVIGRDGIILERFNELPPDAVTHFKKYLPPTTQSNDRPSQSIDTRTMRATPATHGDPHTR